MRPFIEGCHQKAKFTAVFVSEKNIVKTKSYKMIILLRMCKLKRY